MRLAFDYFTPDDHYEALVKKLLPEGGKWCDVGCGRSIFPDNPALASHLATRCRHVLGIDPDDNVRENPYVHEYFQGFVENYKSNGDFDLVTMRMVAEHIVRPSDALIGIAKLMRPGGHAIIYTPHKWTPMSIAATVVPFALHNPLKRVLWSTEARDTFPTQYKLNTKEALEHHSRIAGLQQIHYVRLDDCRITNAYKHLNHFELRLRDLLRAVGIPYPEACIVSVLKKPEATVA